MSPLDLEIVLDKTSPEYYGGDEINGEVLVNIRVPISITEICLKLKGATKIQNSDNETYFNEKIMLYQYHGASAPMDVGTHRFPFSAILSKNLPESFRTTHGEVAYKAKASIKCTENIDILKHDCIKYLHFVVLASVPIPSQFNEPKSREGTKNLPFSDQCCFCRSYGTVTAKLTVDKGGYMVGETISFNAEICNNSSLNLENISLVLKQVAICKTKHDGLKRSTSNVGLKQGLPTGTLLAHDVFTWSGSLMVPSTLPPTNLGTCKKIKVTYFLELEIGENSGICDTDVLFIIPLMLGRTAPSALTSESRNVNVQASDQRPIIRQPLGFKRKSLYHNDEEFDNPRSYTMFNAGRYNVKQ